MGADPTTTIPQALSRRATARDALGKLGDAIADWQKVLKLEPKNKQAAAELASLREVCVMMHVYDYANARPTPPFCDCSPPSSNTCPSTQLLL